MAGSSSWTRTPRCSGDDDDAYERMQLEKIGGGEVPAAPVAQFCGERDADAPSGFMKKRMKKARPRAGSCTCGPSFDP